MKRLLALGIVALASLALLCTEDAFGQKKDKKGAKSTQFPAEPKDYAALQSAKEITGSVQGADGKSITVRIDVPRYEKNPNFKPPTGGNNNNAMQQVNQYSNRIAQLQQQVAAAKTPQQRNDRLRNLQREQNAMQQAIARIQQQQAKAANNTNPNNQPFKVVNDYKDFDLDFTDKVIVRKMFLETGYDDKGNLIEYTKDKIAKLRGDDPKLPGYIAKFDDIQPGVIAKLMLAPVKNTTKVDPKAKDDDLVGTVERPTVRMVILLAEKGNTPTPKGK
ncbi:MAG: hypothetical protein K2X38_20390 [Gemmataceae bacterium]|nr:hypothetical protein [Gemmataceae bacterium]